MNSFTIYHNPQCSKSRQALETLENHGIHPVIIEYLKMPLSLDELKKLRAHFDLQDFVRQEESIFKELNLSLEEETPILQAMVKHPILMQRPIVTYENKAVIGRPPEKILALLASVVR